MEIKNGIPPSILAAATMMLQPYAPDLTPKSLVAALRGYGSGGKLAVRENQPEKPYTRQEVCEILGISMPTLNRYVEAGFLRKIRLSVHTVRIDPASVREFLGEKRKEAV